MQQMIGYIVSSPFGGWVDLKDPRELLLEPGQQLDGDLF